MSRQERRRAERGRKIPAPAGTPRRRTSFWAGLAGFGRSQPWLALLLLLLLYGLLALLAFQPQPHDGGDNAGYVTLARSLLERHAYLDLYDPAEPPHTKYPPVFPLILALAMALGLKPWVGLKLVVLALGGVAVAASFLWLRRRGRPALGMAVAGLLAISPGVLNEAHWVLSDVPFWAFTVLAVWAFERLRADDWRRFGLALAATLLAYFTRSAGLPLVLAATGWLIWRRHWRQLLVFLAVLVPLGIAWWLRSRAAGGVAYAAEFWLLDPYQPHLGRAGIADLVQRLLQNLAQYGTGHLPILLFGRDTAPWAAGALVLVAAGVYGWARQLRRARVAELFLPLYLGLILLWPAVWSSERFLLPVLGLLLAYGGDGIGRAARALSRPAAPVIAAGALALVLVLNVPLLALQVRAGHSCRAAFRAGSDYPCTIPESVEFFLMAEWAGQALPPGSVVLSRKPRLFHVLSGGLKSRNYPLDPSVDALLAEAQSTGARFVVLDRLGGAAQRYLVPALTQRPKAFCVLQTTGPEGTMLYGIRPGAAQIADAPPDTAAYVEFDACTAELLGLPAS